MTTDPDDDRDQLADQIRRLIRQVNAEQKSASPNPNSAATRPQPISKGIAPERSLDEILQKIQRDIKEG
jgi:hypothetical protein